METLLLKIVPIAIIGFIVFSILRGLIGYASYIMDSYR